uniref:Uncharacterized protein n=1 Tax=Arundo donax TaxID=35708 RepID=A0A0A9C6V8_ARUDO
MIARRELVHPSTNIRAKAI